ncbi:MAG: hypothetical protein LC687_02020, partial [Actinobacteria bacterium]|nr:hypothetical protein [Actinomycetota bacterium]
VFWEVGEQQLRNYSGYARKLTPWWHVQAFCTNVKLAIQTAESMPTEERIAAFGRAAIRAICDNMPIEDFQQEYECSYVDESTAWITWEEIKANQQDGLFCKLATSTGKDIGNVLEAINELSIAQSEGKIEEKLGVGVDIGRTRDATEITFCSATTTHQYPMRGQLTLKNVSFDEQEVVLQAVMHRLEVSKMNIDRNGIGMNLAENFEKRYPTKIEGVDFSNTSKGEWAADAKMLFQQRRAPIPVDRDLAYQIHSIKKLVSASKRNIFDNDRNEKHHADKFWSLVLAQSAISRGLGIISGIMGYNERRTQDIRRLN